MEKWIWHTKNNSPERQAVSPFPAGPKVIILFPFSTQLSTKFILLVNVKMPTIVGILTIISTINTTPARLKAINFFICRYFSFYEQLKFRAQFSWAWKKFYNLRARWSHRQESLTEINRKHNWQKESTKEAPPPLEQSVKQNKTSGGVKHV